MGASGVAVAGAAGRVPLDPVTADLLMLPESRSPFARFGPPANTLDVDVPLPGDGATDGGGPATGSTPSLAVGLPSIGGSVGPLGVSLSPFRALESALVAAPYGRASSTRRPASAVVWHPPGF
jgi:hypothetical protein